MYRSPPIVPSTVVLSIRPCGWPTTASSMNPCTASPSEPSSSTHETMCRDANGVVNHDRRFTPTVAKTKMKAAARKRFLCPLLREGSIDAGLGVERRKVVQPLPRPQKFHRELQIAGDGQDNAALGRAVQVGEDRKSVVE